MTRSTTKERAVGASDKVVKTIPARRAGSQIFQSENAATGTLHASVAIRSSVGAAVIACPGSRTKAARARGLGTSATAGKGTILAASGRRLVVGRSLPDSGLPRTTTLAFSPEASSTRVGLAS